MSEICILGNRLYDRITYLNKISSLSSNFAELFSFSGLYLSSWGILSSSTDVSSLLQDGSSSEFLTMQ